MRWFASEAARVSEPLSLAYKPVRIIRHTAVSQTPRNP